jgi:hypothetical protein
MPSRRERGKIKPLSDSVDLDWVFSLHDTKCVRKDETITVKEKEYKVSRYAVKKSLSVSSLT